VAARRFVRRSAVMADHALLVDATVTWYGRSARDLPWRAPSVTPWAVLVSEVMLQQTPVARVLPAYRAWLARWPAPAALAADSAGEAVRMWGKLGYPRRALRLHESAVVIRDRFDGRVPRELNELLGLPGIGAYTARAVAAFAFGQRQPVVDTNVRRVIARAVGGHAEAGTPSATRDHAAASALLPAEPAAAARASVALMELGALVCTSRSPRCGECPLAAQCAWRRTGSRSPSQAAVAARRQRFAGTDRQVRGLLMDVLRASDAPARRAALDLAWPDPVQRERALATLIADGLIRHLPGARFALPG
jgi:A/G-specific adenine glycosylase